LRSRRIGNVPSSLGQASGLRRALTDVGHETDTPNPCSVRK
jgi:hypothetical protein